MNLQIKVALRISRAETVQVMPWPFISGWKPYCRMAEIQMEELLHCLRITRIAIQFILMLMGELRHHQRGLIGKWSGEYLYHIFIYSASSSISLLLHWCYLLFVYLFPDPMLLLFSSCKSSLYSRLFVRTFFFLFSSLSYIYPSASCDREILDTAGNSWEDVSFSTRSTLGVFRLLLFSLDKFWTI